MENLMPGQNLALDIPNLKKEVKVEHIMVRPFTPMLYNSHTKTLFEDTQFNLNKILFGYLQENLSFRKITIPPATHWPVLMPDLSMLKAFAQFKPVSLVPPRSNLFREPISQNVLVSKETEKETNGNKSASTVYNLNVLNEEIAKKEEPTEYRTCSCCADCTNQDKKKKEKEKKVPKKKGQNRIKNIPGLIVQRVKSSIKKYYNPCYKFDNIEKRLAYINKAVDGLNKSEVRQLLIFVEGYQKRWKTWSTIENFLQTDSKYGEIFLDAVLRFFGPDGLEDFNDWLTSGRMGEKSKVAITEMKEKIYTKFSKIWIKSEEGPTSVETMEDENEVKEEASNFPNKIVKKEEN